MENIRPKVQTKLFGLDHLRALAILLVLGFHYQRPNFGHPDWVTKLNNIGWTGVDLFFVLSGFLIASQLFQQINKSQTISIKNFYLQRFFRIIPVYLVVIGIYFYFPVFREKEALPPLWKFLTFTQNFGLDQKNYGTFSHVWSLCVEEHFYLFFPIILIAFQQNKLLKRSYWILLFLFLIGFFIRSYCWNNLYLYKENDANNFAYWMKYIYYPTYNRLDGLLAGVSIASIYQFSPTIWNKISKYGNQLIIMSLIILTTSLLFCSQLGEYSTAIIGFPVISIGYGFLVLGAISPSSFLYKWNSKTTTMIATLSYAIYLTHKGMIHMAQELFTKLGIDKNGNLMFLICITFCILAAWLLNVTIEKPFMKIRDRIIEQKIKPTTTNKASPGLQCQR